MPGFVLSVGAAVTCSHGGQVKVRPAQIRALAGGTPILTLADQLTVAGCPGVSGSPPCTLVQWTNVSGRVSASGQPVLVQSLPPTGPVPGGGTVAGPPPPVPLVMAMQLRVVAT
jgi:hypothetical protein